MKLSFEPCMLQKSHLLYEYTHLASEYGQIMMILVIQSAAVCWIFYMSWYDQKQMKCSLKVERDTHITSLDVAREPSRWDFFQPPGKKNHNPIEWKRKKWCNTQWNMPNDRRIVICKWISYRRVFSTFLHISTVNIQHHSSKGGMSY